MPTRLSIIHTNRANDATLSLAPGPAATGYPVDNLKTVLRSDTVRAPFNGAGQCGVYLTWPAAVTVNAAAICHHNLSAGAQFLITLYSDAAFTTLIASTGWLSATDLAGLSPMRDSNSQEFRPFRNSAAWLSTYTNVRSAAITVLDTANAFGFFECARVFAGVYRELNWNFSWSNQLEFRSRATHAETFGGSLLTQFNGHARRRVRLPFEGLDQADIDFLIDLINTASVVPDVFVSGIPDASGGLRRNYEMWGKLVEWDTIGYGAPNWFGAGATFASC